MGYAVTTYQQGFSHSAPVIGFDMGGTSTDVSRYDGHYEHVFESTTGGVTIQAPQVHVYMYVKNNYCPTFQLDIHHLAIASEYPHKL